MLPAVRIVAVSLDTLALYREVRLRALAESPQAFDSTYARESGLSDEDWRRRLQRWDGHKGIGFLAVCGGSGCGMAGGLVDEADASLVQLVSMWTAPEHRRLGLGRMLVEVVMQWAEKRGAQRMTLLVTSNNEGAMRFYQSLGFASTGRTAPYPNDAALHECEMQRELSRK